MRLRPAALLTCALAAALALTAPAAHAQDLDDFIAGQMRAQRIPGLAIAVVKNGEVVAAKGYGLADVQDSVPVLPATVFRIASVSKQFIAAGTMLLVQQGRLGLDDPIVRYLEDAPESWNRITVRHVLTHTSGLVREGPGFHPERMQSDADVVRSAYELPLQFQPGEKWEYCNLGYFILAEIITVVSGQPWSEFFVEHVFRPAGMLSTRATHDRGDLTGIAQGYSDNDAWDEAPDWLVSRPSGAFFSTVLDLAKWEAVLHARTLLADSTLRAMWTPATLNDGSRHPYGFGWILSDVAGRPAIHHGGGMPGARAYYLRFPDEALTIILLANLDDMDPVGLVNGIAALYLPAAGGRPPGLSLRRSTTARLVTRLTAPAR